MERNEGRERERENGKKKNRKAQRLRESKGGKLQGEKSLLELELRTEMVEIQGLLNLGSEVQNGQKRMPGK